MAHHLMTTAEFEEEYKVENVRDRSPFTCVTVVKRQPTKKGVPAVYEVRFSPKGGDDRCDCQAYQRGGSGTCKHLAALRELYFGKS